jgi:hypothetical protein
MTSILRKNKGYALLAISLAATAFIFLQLRERQADPYQEHPLPGGDELDSSSAAIGGAATKDTVEPILPAVLPTKHHFRGLITLPV